MTEDRATRLRRLGLRSMRRGIREMDLILSAFADTRLAGLNEQELDDYEALLEENDQDLYGWVAGQAEPPGRHARLIAEIAATTPEVARRFR